MATINPALPAANHIAGDANHPQDHDTIVLALAAIISTINIKVESVNTKKGIAVTLTASDVGADANGAATQAISDLVTSSDPLGDRDFASRNFRPVIEYNYVTSTWPTRASSTADQTVRFEWVGPTTPAPPAGGGYSIEGDLLTGLV